MWTHDGVGWCFMRENRAQMDNLRRVGGAKSSFGAMPMRVLLWGFILSELFGWLLTTTLELKRNGMGKARGLEIVSS